MQPELFYDPRFIGVIMTLVLIEVVLKGFALWRSARINKLWWFVTILVINSAGVFPLIYLIMTNEQYKELQAKHAPDMQSV